MSQPEKVQPNDATPNLSTNPDPQPHHLPSDLTTSQHRTLERLRSKPCQLSHNLAKCEAFYRDLGLRFFEYPLAVRNEFMQDANLISMFTFSNNDDDDSHHNNGDDNKNTGVQREPLILSRLIAVRNMKATLQDHLRRRDVRTAKYILSAAEDYLREVWQELVVALDELNGVEDLYLEKCLQGMFEDEGLPLFFPGRERQRDWERFAAKFEAIRVWCLALPEVREAVRLGLMDGEGAVRDLLAEEGEERFADVVWELVFEDTEAEVAGSLDGEAEDGLRCEVRDGGGTRGTGLYGAVEFR